MRWFVTVMILLCASLAACTRPAPTQPSTTVNGTEIFGTGSGHVDLAELHHSLTFNVSAHTGPQGAYGSARLTFDQDPTVDVHVNVDCLHVFPRDSGAGAWVSGLVDRVTPDSNRLAIQPGDRLFFLLVDNGNPGNSPADHIGLYLFADWVPCEWLSPSSGGTPIDTGNIVISVGS
jgi:hypothetical protein